VDSETHKTSLAAGSGKDIDLGNWATERYVISETGVDEEAREKTDASRTDEGKTKELLPFRRLQQRKMNTHSRCSPLSEQKPRVHIFLRRPAVGII